MGGESVFVGAAQPASVVVLQERNVARRVRCRQRRRRGGMNAQRCQPRKATHHVEKAAHHVEKATHHVRFAASVIVHEITPYAEIYGIHPRLFDFSRGYWMVPSVGLPDAQTIARVGAFKAAGENVEDYEVDEEDSSDEEW